MNSYFKMLPWRKYCLRRARVFMKTNIYTLAHAFEYIYLQGHADGCRITERNMRREFKNKLKQKERS